MVRSHSRKLIRSERRDESLFFDLEKDPMEMTNVFNAPEYVEDIRAMESAAESWLGSDPDLGIHLDLSAPSIEAQNVPAKDDNHRADIAGYYQRVITEQRKVGSR